MSEKKTHRSVRRGHHKCSGCRLPCRLPCQREFLCCLGDETSPSLVPPPPSYFLVTPLGSEDQAVSQGARARVRLIAHKAKSARAVEHCVPVTSSGSTWRNGQHKVRAHLTNKVHTTIGTHFSTVSPRREKRQRSNRRLCAMQGQCQEQSDSLKWQTHRRGSRRMHIRVHRVHSRDTGTSRTLY